MGGFGTLLLPFFKMEKEMTQQPTRILDENSYTIKFGINGGLTIVRAVSFDKIMALTEDQLRLLFQPSNSRKLRQFGLEAIVNGRISPYQASCIQDLIDLTELATSISCQQFSDPLVTKQIIKNIHETHKCRVRESNVIRHILIDMFENNQLEVSLIHLTQFSKLFSLTKEDDLLKIVKTVTKKFHLVNKIFLVSMGNKSDTKVYYFITRIFPSIVRALNTVSSEGRRIRGSRELTKHRRDVLTNKQFEYTAEEAKELLNLLDSAILEASKLESIIN